MSKESIKSDVDQCELAANGVIAVIEGLDTIEKKFMTLSTVVAAYFAKHEKVVFYNWLTFLKAQIKEAEMLDACGHHLDKN